jgi:SAM-dependent methyltransferase
VVDQVFAHPRLAALYDTLDGVRDDLDLYLALVSESGSRSVLDLGCGTGTFACLLAGRGIDVVAMDPAGASLDIARRKPGAELVRWVEGDVTRLPALQVDTVTMTGNVAQVFLNDGELEDVLRAARRSLRPGGTLLFEVRDPAKRAWEEWNRATSYRQLEVDGVGTVETWVDVTELDLPRLSFRWTFVFPDEGVTLISDSTLRFRTAAEITTSVERAGLEVVDIRDAPDRPGLEHVFVVRRPS